MGDNEPIPYKITKADGSSGPDSRDYTGKVELVEYPNRDTYTGDFVNGVKEGKGTYTFANEDVYTGEWKNNLQSGIGRTIYKKGGKYVGRYENGFRNGEGVFTYANGDIYSGGWKDGKKHGKGTYIVNSSSLPGNNYMKIVGDWSNGEIVEGKWIFPDKTVFEGLFEKNLPKNKGQWKFSNGNVITGEYSHSKARAKEDNQIETKLSWKTEEEVFDPNKHLVSG